MSKQNFFYIKVRVELNEAVSEAKLAEIVQELDYDIESTVKGIVVEKTSIEESSKDFDFNKTF